MSAKKKTRYIHVSKIKKSCMRIIEHKMPRDKKKERNKKKVIDVQKKKGGKKSLGILYRDLSRSKMYEWTLPVGECWPQTTSHTKCLLNMYDLRPTSHKFRITLEDIFQKFPKTTLRGSEVSFISNAHNMLRVRSSHQI